MSSDSAPDSVFLPWNTIQGLRVHRYLRRDALVVDLHPGVGSDTPGVLGLEHPDIQLMLTKRMLGTVGFEPP
ncbi:hypothetical protein [Nocardia sp. SYP-A9097]|uniref:hypothetical protein n=1 Tax=Nocardia sp. SYP-A9097 TaxID=2663237 RepID=UPI00129AD36B|nr:hypothetical protein [Nocardia sp. SYP-A9097]